AGRGAPRFAGRERVVLAAELEQVHGRLSPRLEYEAAAFRESLADRLSDVSAPTTDSRTDLIENERSAIATTWNRHALPGRLLLTGEGRLLTAAESPTVHGRVAPVHMVCEATTSHYSHGMRDRRSRTIRMVRGTGGSALPFARANSVRGSLDGEPRPSARHPAWF
ncbi:hypothetical protein, partial [Natrinema soli]